MAKNPMQRKTGNAFALGMFVMLVIAAIIFAAVYFLIISPKKGKKEKERVEVIVYTLNQPVKSGQIITQDMFTQMTVYQDMVPANFVDMLAFENLALQDTSGNIIYTDETGTMYVQESGKKIPIINENGNYYKKYTDTNKEYIKFITVPIVAKIDMEANTVLAASYITKSDEVVTSDLRLVEYNMLSLPITLEIGDYIDVRFTMPSGQDFIVLSKKEIKNIQDDTISFYLTEEEILLMNSAMVEAYIMTASNFYAVQYVEPGMQTASTYTYVPTNDVIDLINMDSNIVVAAKEKLATIYGQSSYQGIRGSINTQINYYSEESLENLETGILAQIEKAKEARRKYLTGVTSY